MWVEVVILIASQAHLISSGFGKCLAFAVSINKGLPKAIADNYPRVIAVIRPLISVPSMLNSDWINGFTDDDNSFNIIITKKDYF